MAGVSKSGRGAAREQVEVVLDADIFSEACRVGTLFYASARGHGVFSFAYDREWLSRPDAFQLDPDLQLHGSESYPSNAAGVFRIFVELSAGPLGASPDGTPRGAAGAGGETFAAFPF